MTTTVPRLLARLRSSFSARVVLLLALALLLASTSSYLTQGIREAVGGNLDLWFLPHLLSWTLWLGLLWACLAARHRLLPRLRRSTGVRVLGEVLFGLLYTVVSVETTYQLLSGIFGPPELPGGMSIQNVKPLMMMRAASMYALVAVSLAALTAELERRRREDETRALLLQQERLRSQLVTVRLETLQAQLHPHFLFNALHAIGGLILSEDKLRAHRALASLSTLLRRSLKHGEAQRTSVEEELDLIRQYVELEQIRFGDRLRFQLQASPEARGASVPALLLLPIVENAITHGIEPLPEGGSIEVDVRVVDGHLELSVRDDGVGRTGADREATGARHASTGIGLANTAGRLEALYGPGAELAVLDGAPRGTHVHIRLPLERAPASMEAAS